MLYNFELENGNFNCRTFPFAGENSFATEWALYHYTLPTYFSQYKMSIHIKQYDFIHVYLPTDKFYYKQSTHCIVLYLQRIFQFLRICKI